MTGNDFSSVAVSWVTKTAASTSETILYGTNPSALTSSSMATSNVSDDSSNIAPITIHNGLITNLALNSRYYYSVGDNSTVYSFYNYSPNSYNKTYALMADLGLVDDYAMSTILDDANNDVFQRLIISEAT